MRQPLVPSPGGEDLLQKGMATHSSAHLGNLMDRGARQAIVHEVTKSRTRPGNEHFENSKNAEVEVPILSPVHGSDPCKTQMDAGRPQLCVAASQVWYLG